MLDEVGGARACPQAEWVPLEAALGRVLAEPVLADRDYPPLPRSLRDGFAVRAADLPGRLRLIGEVRAGQVFSGRLGPGEAVEIMTGAPVPAGADAVVMYEHVQRDGWSVAVEQHVRPGQWICPPASEARRGEPLLDPGVPLGFAEVAVLATVGRAEVAVYPRPSVAILPTGDELVEPHASPQPHQIRNSNAYSLAAQVRRAGGSPRLLPVAPDDLARLRALLERGLETDLLIVSGGVSAGKYDLVERALAELGARWFFDGVLLQPGQPVVFGCARGTFFFGLPGNPVCTMVTFEVLARAAVELLAGQREPLLPLFWARLAAPFRHKPGLTRFHPARLGSDGSVTPLEWRGSADVAAIARSNAFLMAEPERESWEAGEWIRVLPR